MNIIEENIVGIVDPVLNYSLENFPEINSEEWSINSVVSKCNKVTVNVLDGSHFQLTPKEAVNFTDVITINLVYTNDGTPDFYNYRSLEFGLNVIAYNLPTTWDVTNNNNFDVSVGFEKASSYSGDPVDIYTYVGTEKTYRENFTQRTDAFMVNLHPGETLYMYSDTMTKYNNNNKNPGMQFRCTADVSFGGNIMAMLKDETLVNHSLSYFFKDCTQITTAPALPATTLANNCYRSMFRGCTSLVNAPVLPATTVGEYSYASMFNNCTSLVTPPALPATTVAQYCYYYMFEGCSSLTTAPDLPAEILADQCYSNMFLSCTALTTPPVISATTLASDSCRSMFNTCTALTTAPALPATTLAENCYSNMFRGCTALTTAPALPATTLANYCYSSMFQNCTSLTTAPALPATTLRDGCYVYMFKNCTSLNYIKALFRARTNSQMTEWVNGVAATGTFITNPNPNYDAETIRGTSGIPNGWEIYLAVS